MEQDNQTWQVHAKSIWKAQLFIQENLDEELTLYQVAKAASFSPYHFHRIFRAFTGESIHNYIRRLRMEKAAGRLKYTQHPVTDIALDSGYQTPSSFSRAFNKVMGVSPFGYRREEEVRVDGKQVNQSTKGQVMIKPDIEKIPDLSVLFVRRVGSYQTTPPEAWNTLMNFVNKYYPKLSDARKFSLGLDDPVITEEEKLRFDACLAAPEDVLEKGDVGRQILKGGKYAIFLHRGPYETLENTFDAIFQEWYPNHKEEVAELPCFCEHLNMELMETNPDELLTKIYVPLK